MKKRDIDYFAAGAGDAGVAAARSSAVTGFTTIPLRIFWSPSTTTRSPGLSHSLMT